MPPQGQQSDLPDSVVHAFLDEDEDTQRAALGTMSEDTQRTLLAGITRVKNLEKNDAWVAAHPRPDIATAPERFLKSFATGTAKMAAGLAGGAGPGQAVQAGADLAVDESQREQEGRSLPYRVAAGLAEGTGIADPKGMEESAEKGDSASILGSATASAAPVLIGGTEKGRALTEGAVDRVKGGWEELQAPRRFETGVEGMFKGLQPGAGDDVWFRNNLETAAGDIADIERKSPLEGQTGQGLWKPDKRLRNWAGSVIEHQAEMYKNERAAPVQRNANAMMSLGVGDPSTFTETMGTLSHELPRGKAATVAARLARNPKEPISLADGDALARAVNAEMLKYNKMTPSEAAAAQATQRKIDGIGQVDEVLQQGIGDTLRSRNEVSLDNYEQRYAALSKLRDAAQKKMNSAEAFRMGNRIRLFISGANPLGTLRETMQVSPQSGRSVQKGARRLAASGVEAEKPVGLPPPPGPTALAKTGPGRAPTTVLPSSGKPFVGEPWSGTVGRPGVVEMPGDPAKVEQRAAYLYNRGQVPIEDLQTLERSGILTKGAVERIKAMSQKMPVKDTGERVSSSRRLPAPPEPSEPAASEPPPKNLDPREQAAVDHLKNVMDSKHVSEDYKARARSTFKRQFGFDPYQAQ